MFSQNHTNRNSSFALQYTESYRYGFNGQEGEEELYGTGNATSAEYWMYDARLGRRWDNDPITYPWQSPYAAFNNNPIYFADPLGLEGTGGSGDNTMTWGNGDCGGGNESKGGDEVSKAGEIAGTVFLQEVVVSALRDNTLENVKKYTENLKAIASISIKSELSKYKGKSYKTNKGEKNVYFDFINSKNQSKKRRLFNGKGNITGLKGADKALARIKYLERADKVLTGMDIVFLTGDVAVNGITRSNVVKSGILVFESTVIDRVMTTGGLPGLATGFTYYTLKFFIGEDNIVYLIVEGSYFVDNYIAPAVQSVINEAIEDIKAVNSFINQKEYEFTKKVESVWYNPASWGVPTFGF